MKTQKKKTEMCSNTITSSYYKKMDYMSQVLRGQFFAHSQQFQSVIVLLVIKFDSWPGHLWDKISKQRNLIGIL